MDSTADTVVRIYSYTLLHTTEEAKKERKKGSEEGKAAMSVLPSLPTHPLGQAVLVVVLVVSSILAIHPREKKRGDGSTSFPLLS